jgi:uncharacterized protein YuzE
MTAPLQKIEYDQEVDALYIYASRAKVKKTFKLNSRLLIDVDSKGRLVGIEVLDASEPFKLERLGIAVKNFSVS